MTLIKSISGIRGTIGGKTGDTLNPLDIVKFTTAYATFIQRQVTHTAKRKIVVGRDARISGEMVRSVVCGTLIGMGYDQEKGSCRYFFLVGDPVIILIQLFEPTVIVFQVSVQSARAVDIRSEFNEFPDVGDRVVFSCGSWHFVKESF